MTKILIIAAAALTLSALPVSLQPTSTGLAIQQDQAQAIYGRPGTPRSVAGYARRGYRHARRAVRRCVRWSGGACVGWAYY